jgi:hypothetical protein
MAFWNDVNTMAEWIENKIKSPSYFLAAFGLVFLLSLLLPELFTGLVVYALVGAILAVYAIIPTFVVMLAATGIVLTLKEIVNSIIGDPHESLSDNFSLAFNVAKYTSLTVGFIFGGFLPVIIGGGIVAVSMAAGSVLTKALSYIFATFGVAAERIFDPAPRHTYNIIVNEGIKSQLVGGDKLLGLEGTHARTVAQLENGKAEKSSVTTSASSALSSGSHSDGWQSVQPSVPPYATTYPHHLSSGPLRSTFAPSPPYSSYQQSVGVGRHPAVFLSAPPRTNPYHTPEVDYRPTEGTLIQPPFAQQNPSAQVDGSPHSPTHHIAPPTL